MAYDITIQKVTNGYVVRVGCQTFVFESLHILLAELERYFENPEEIEKLYRQIYHIKNGPEVQSYMGHSAAELLRECDVAQVNSVPCDCGRDEC